MKRQATLIGFFGPCAKKQKTNLEETIDETSHDKNIVTITETSCADLGDDGQLPSGLSTSLLKTWKDRHPWIISKGGKLFCEVCIGFGTIPIKDKSSGIRIEKQWIETGVQGGGVKGKERKKLSEKVLEHSRSKSHNFVVEGMKKREDNQITSSLQEQQLRASQYVEKQHSETIRVFRTCYMIAKEDMSFKKLRKLIELQELNGLHMGSLLFSDHSCCNIIMFVAREMKRELVKYLSGPKCNHFSIIVDESTTVNNRSVLISYVRIMVNDEVQNVFWESSELSGTTAESIAQTLYDSFTSSLDIDIIKRKLLAVGSDGASVMIGHKGGVTKKFSELIGLSHLPSFHCVAHRLELTVHDACKSVTKVNHFVTFLDKLYCTFSRSPKNQRLLEEVAFELNCTLRKVGKIFDVRWCFSSYCAINSLWNNFLSLHTMFTKTNQSDKLPKLGKLMERVEFVEQMCTIRDCLYELKSLSLKVSFSL